MRVTGYRSAGIRVAVDLVNAATTRDGQCSDDALRELLIQHRFHVTTQEPEDGEMLRHWAFRIRPLFVASTLQDAVTVANDLLASARLGPHISDHGLGLHLHHAPPGAGLVDRVRALTAVDLAEIICEYGVSRSGACSATNCDRVYADTSRNAGKRYCSAACANRSAVARFRARTADNPRRSATPASLGRSSLLYELTEQRTLGRGGPVAPEPRP